jgi:hypothetical protein
MEQKIFVYRKKVDISDFYGAIGFGVAAALSWYFHMGIRIKNLKLLAYPNSVYVLGGLALITLAYGLWKFYHANQSKSNPHSITLGETSFSFPYKNDKVEVAFSEIDSTERRSDDDDNSFVVTVKGKDYEFFEDYFENPAKYTAFAESVEKY